MTRYLGKHLDLYIREITSQKVLKTHLYSGKASELVWLVVWLPFFIFPLILGIIIPIDFHIFQRGSNHQPVMGFYGDLMVFNGIWWDGTTLVIQKTMEHHQFSWVNQLFLWPCSIAECQFTRGYRLSTGLLQRTVGKGEIHALQGLYFANALVHGVFVEVGVHISFCGSRPVKPIFAKWWY